jgi:hypothetical protein
MSVNSNDVSACNRQTAIVCSCACLFVCLFVCLLACLFVCVCVHARARICMYMPWILFYVWELCFYGWRIHVSHDVVCSWTPYHVSHTRIHARTCVHTHKSHVPEPTDKKRHMHRHTLTHHAHTQNKINHAAGARNSGADRRGADLYYTAGLYRRVHRHGHQLQAHCAVKQLILVV